MNLTSYFLALSCLTSTSAFADTLPSRFKDIGVGVAVSLDMSRHIYAFTYRVTNPKTNDANLQKIRIGISFDPGNDATLPKEGLTHCLDHLEGMVSKGLIVPVGSATPKGWSCDYRPEKEFSFGAIDRPYLLKPGSSRDDLIMTSYGLPGIRSVIAKGDVDFDKLPPEWNEDIEKQTQLAAKLTWFGKTIGPKAPPLRFTAVSFIDYISLLNEQAAVQSWVKTKKSEDNFELQLAGIKKRIVAKDMKSAKSLLKAFMDSVKAQNGKGLSSEGYALLYFNAQYLMEHL